MADEYNIKPDKEHLPVERPIYFSGDLFGDYIRKRRIELGLSLRQLQDRSGIHNSRLSRWERGEQRPESPDLLAPLATALDLPLADLCQRAGHDITKGLPHLTSYLHLKYGPHLPTDALHELIAHCEAVLGRHGIHVGDAKTA